MLPKWAATRRSHHGALPCENQEPHKHRKREREPDFSDSLGGYLVFIWSGREDLNLRSHDPQSCALTRLRYVPAPSPKRKAFLEDPRGVVNGKILIRATGIISGIPRKTRRLSHGRADHFGATHDSCARAQAARTGFWALCSRVKDARPPPRCFERFEHSLPSQGAGAATTL